MFGSFHLELKVCSVHSLLGVSAHTRILFHSSCSFIYFIQVVVFIMCGPLLTKFMLCWFVQFMFPILRNDHYFFLCFDFAMAGMRLLTTP